MPLAAIMGAAGAVNQTKFGVFDRWQQNRQFNKSHDLHEQINQQNYGLQRDKFRYQQQSNQLTRDREDNQMQRKVKDMVAAGLHPTLAAGGGAGAQALGANPGSAGGGAPAGKGSAADPVGAELGQIASNIRLQDAQAGAIEADQEREDELHNHTVRQMIQDLYAGKVNIEHVREKIIDLRTQAEEDDRRYELDRDNFNLRRTVEMRQLEIANYELALFLHDSDIIRASGMTTNQKANFGGQLMQILGAIGDGSVREAVRGAVDELSDIKNEYKEDILDHLLSLLGPLGWFIQNRRRR